MTQQHHKPRISLLIAARNEGRHLASTLDTICEQSCPDHWLEVLVLDGNSTDNTVEIAMDYLDRLASLRILNNPGVLSSSGWNIGIEHALAPVVVLLSGHVSLPSNYCHKVLKALVPEYAGVGGMAIPTGNDDRSNLIAHAFSSALGNGNASFMVKKPAGAVESIAFGCYWRHIILSVGGFDEQIVRGQDWDLNLRLRQAGYVLWYLPDIEMHYFTRSDFRALWRRQFTAGLWKNYIHVKSSVPMLLRHWIPGMFVFGMVLTAFLALFSEHARWLLLGGALLHIAAGFWQCRAMNLPWSKAPLFWWSILLIHTAYGAGMLKGILRMPAKPSVNKNRK